MSAKTIPPSPVAQRAAPITSTRRPATLGVRGTAASTSTTVPATSGTLSANTQRHETWSTITPPASGPMTAAIPLHAVQVPIAGPRSRAENALMMIASELGVSNAAATPCKARAAISTPIVGARAHATENTPNAATPTVNTRRSP